MKITTGPQPGPQRCLITGVPGVGKSTFAAGAPDALFLQLERGVDHLDVAKTELMKEWSDVEAGLTYFTLPLPYGIFSMLSTPFSDAVCLSIRSCSLVAVSMTSHLYGTCSWIK